jgi:hypothetical protein
VHLSDRTKWWLLFLFDFFNAPLVGAILGTIIGLVPALHVAFFSDTEDGGIFTAWLTESLKSIGLLFVPLPVVIAGVSLYTSTQKVKNEDGDSGAGTPWLTTLFVLVVRFAIWPVMSIGVVYFLAKKTDSLGADPMLWFTMMLMPTYVLPDSHRVYEPKASWCSFTPLHQLLSKTWILTLNSQVVRRR